MEAFVNALTIERPTREIFAFLADWGPVMAGAMRRANRKDLARLKQLFETRAPTA